MSDSSVVKSIPQPLSGLEIKLGIAARMAQGLPPEVGEQVREQLVAGLSKTCLLMPSSAYSKFSAKWSLACWPVGDKVQINWWVNFSLDDYGRVTNSAIGNRRNVPPENMGFEHGVIEEMPPDRFRRETEQPIPKPTELKAPEPEKSVMSRSIRGQGKGRMV